MSNERRPAEQPRPSQPVDISAPKLDHVESRLAGAVGLVPLAALVFGALIWASILFGQRGSSETELVQRSWFAIFPSVFGLVAHLLRRQRMRDGKPAVAMPFLVGAAAGAAGVLAMMFFYVAIWPSL